MFKKSLFALFMIGLVLPSISFSWEGKVIGLRGCRAVIVFDGKNFPVTVFLRGVDPAKTCPQGARQFVSGAVFGKQVEVKDEQKTEGGVAAEVMMEDGKSLNKELLKQDFMRNAAPIKMSEKVPSASRAEASQPSPRSARKAPSSAVQQSGELSAAPGVRKWRDKDGNIHFSGIAGRK